MKKTNKMPEKTVFNLVRALLMLPFVFLLALNTGIESLVTALLLLVQSVFYFIFKAISFCIRGVMMVIGGSFYTDIVNMNK